MHAHVGVVEFAEFALYAVIFGFLWRTLAALWADNRVGQAMAFIY